MSLHFPFPTVFRFPDSSDLNVDYMYRVDVVDKNNATLTESSLFYLRQGMPPASTPAMLDSGGSGKQDMSPGLLAGLAVGLFLVVVISLALGGWKLRRFLKYRSMVKRRASVQASIRHFVPVVPQQAILMNETELNRISGRPSSLQVAASQTYVRPTPEHDFVPPARPPRPSSSIYSLDHSLDTKVLPV